MMDTVQAVATFKKAADTFRATSTADNFRILQIESRAAWSAIHSDSLWQLPLTKSGSGKIPGSTLDTLFVEQVKDFIETTREVLEVARLAQSQIAPADKNAYSYYLAQCAARQALAETFLDQGMDACNAKSKAQGKRFEAALEARDKGQRGGR